VTAVLEKAEDFFAQFLPGAQEIEASVKEEIRFVDQARNFRASLLSRMRFRTGNRLLAGSHEQVVSTKVPEPEPGHCRARSGDLAQRFALSMICTIDDLHYR
jgi:hypothetical protein